MKPRCVIPWLYFSTLPDGNVTPCCVSEIYTYGNVSEQDPKDIWNNEPAKKLRRDLLGTGELPDACSRCRYTESMTQDYSKETNSTYNLRLYYNDIFKDYIDEIVENTNEDGSIPKDKIKFRGWNFRLSNQCNLKCRMCNSDLSSSMKMEKTPNENPIIKNFYYKKFLEENIDDLELIEINGGETLLWEETYDMMDYIIEKNKHNHIKLYFNTNMTVKGLGKKIMLDYWRKWNPEKLEIVASIDEIGDRAECIRKGTKWDVVENNLKELSNEKFTLNTNIVLSCYNVFRLPEIIQHLTDIGYINERFNHRNFMLGPVNGTQMCWLFSKDFKEKIIKKNIEFIKEYNRKYSTNISNKFKYIFKILSFESSSGHKQKAIFEFIKEENKFNLLRDENIFKVIPELNDIVNQLKK